MQDVFQECYLELHSAKSPGKVHTSDARPTCSKMGKHQREPSFDRVWVWHSVHGTGRTCFVL